MGKWEKEMKKVGLRINQNNFLHFQGYEFNFATPNFLEVGKIFFRFM